MSSIVSDVRHLIYYSIMIWMKKPGKERGEAFSYHQHSQFKTMAVFLSILLIIEGVLFHFLVQMWSELAAWILSAINIYGLFYLMALYKSAKYLPHLVVDNRIIIRCGYQNRIEVPLNNVAVIQKAKEISMGEKIPKDMHYAVIICDSPQYEIVLKEPIETKGLFGRTIPKRSVVFRCDNPEALLLKLNQGIQHANGG
ncbi:hypothetical protein RQP50_21810 [Paenibacillus sp. chi10]|uniref:Uncharacterized protein n=1 Tax=Paenibacillus suaedae TaxID=3077233 RepID=A0AAJ2K320_9BACL|nr:hypothetical protein [Paenibacillus sp. chi10]MDT8978878.1 hypothetical protein [Paenibacillus sp. chi10]